MTTMVCFRGDDGGEYAVPIEDVREVRPTTALLPLPSPRPGVAGLLRHDVGAFPVLSTFGECGSHVLLFDRAGAMFGLVVQQVTKVMSFEGTIERAPRGQDRVCISGMITTDSGIVFVLDVGLLDEGLQS